MKWLILLIEDESHDAEAFHRAVGGQHDVIEAGSLARADELLQLHDPDAIIADIGLPDGDFETVLTWLLSRHEHTPCIVYSGSGQYVERCRELGLRSLRKLTGDRGDEINRVLMEAAREVMKRVRARLAVASA